MSARRTVATAGRVLRQLRRDHRTLGLLLFLPSILLLLLRWVFDGREPAFQNVTPILLVLFPFIIMFIVTSVAVLRERTSGTLERLLTTPLGKLDLLLGYALAFGLVTLVQVGLALTIAVGLLDLEVQGGIGLLALIAVLDALLGMALGLFFSAFARTEFQAVQFMPAIVFPQLLLCGLLIPRDEMPGILEGVSNALPLSYAVDGVTRVAQSATVSDALLLDLGVVAACVVAAVALGAVTLRRRSA